MKLIYTPIAISLCLLIIVALITSFNGLFIDNKGGNSLGGAIALVFAICFFIVLILEQTIIKNLKAKMRFIWLWESILIIVSIIIWGYNGFGFSIG